jgi:Histidine kinase/Bacterial extracellular solute-binding proteins, family 3
MRFKPRAIYYLIAGIILFTSPLQAQDTWKADSWEQVFANKKGTVTALWYDIEPFIYKNSVGQLEGVEYEIMESLKTYLKNRYGIELSVNWVNARSFENIYEQVKQTKQNGVFGWSYYSITPERKKEVQFSPPYMPDLNIVVTNSSEPVYATAQELTGKLKDMQAYTMANTTMDEDVLSLKNNFDKELKVARQYDDYDVMRNIAADRKGFGYVPLSVYIVGLQKGIKVKRQNVLSTRREGFAAVMPLHSDWKQLVDEYFNTEEFMNKAGNIVTKYLGTEVSDLVLGHKKDSAGKRMTDLELVSLEKEIVTKRLVETALQVQRERNIRSAIVAAIGLGLIFFFLTYRRYIAKQRINKELMQRNEIIMQQKKEIEKINRTLQLKFLQSRLNPHFLFNSLNAIQYFVGINDRKAAMGYISSFSAFLRQHLQTAASLTHSVLKEATMLKQYLELEKNRFAGKFNFDIELPQDPDLLELHMPSLLTHSFVEYALYNRVLNRTDNSGMITVTFTKAGETLLITIDDNGIGKKMIGEFTEKKEINELTPDAGLVQERLSLLNADLGKQKITITEDYKTTEKAVVTGTVTIISIPA